MEFFEVIEKRQSIRAFAPQPVEAEKLQHILAAANSAPSAGNLQAYEIYVVHDETRRLHLAQAALGQDFIQQAPVVLVFCTNPERSQPRYGRRGARLYSVQDATIACTHAMLAATALGLGSVWVGAFDEQGVIQAIQSLEGQVPVAILPIGYPAEEPERRTRRSLEDLAHRR